jgi:hypothetical protein
MYLVGDSPRQVPSDRKMKTRFFVGRRFLTEGSSVFNRSMWRVLLNGRQKTITRFRTARQTENYFSFLLP